MVKKQTKKIVLLVEDEPATISMYSVALKKLDCDTEIACTYEQGIKKINQIKPDIVLLDLLIPETSCTPLDFTRRMGFELLEKIREKKELKKVPILILTNLDSIEDRERSKQLGSLAYIVKSNTLPKEIIDTIQHIFKK